MKHFSYKPNNYQQAQQYALPLRQIIANNVNTSPENTIFSNGKSIRNEIQHAEKKEQDSINTNRKKPKASKPLILNPPKIIDQPILFKQIGDYEESGEGSFNETENEVKTSELETQFLIQLSEQIDHVTKEMEELQHSSDEDKNQKGTSSDGIQKEENKDYTHQNTIEDESSTFIENESSLNEDLVGKFSAMLEESDTLQDESSSSHDERSFSNDNAPNYEDKISLNEDLVKEFTALLEESSSFTDETSSSYDRPFCTEESSCNIEESSKESSSSTDETSSSYDEPSSSEESSFNFEDSSKESSSFTDETSSSSDESSCSGESSFNFDESSQGSSSIVSYLDKCKESVQFPIVKLPVLLTLLNFDIDIYDSINLEVPVASVTKVDWSINSLDCKVLLPTPNVFLKGELIAEIEYVKENVTNTLQLLKITIPIEKVIMANWLYSPKTPSTHQAEYMFQSNEHTDIQYHHEFIRKFAEPIYSELQSVHFVWHNELISNNNTQKLDIQGIAQLSVSLLQSQFVDLNIK